MEIEGFARLERLHDGGQAVVYRAWRVADGLPVVLKILKGPYPTPAQLSRFADERRLTERVRGPGVVEVEGWTTDGALSVLVLRDRGCESLDRVFPEPPSMDVGLDLARRIVSIVQRVHRAGVLHLDLNPANIVHDPASGTLEIIDFGVATDRQRLGAELAGAQLARGTPAFSAPEQTGPMNRSVDHRSDLYALGSTLYWLFTGQPPFPQTDALELVHAHVAREPRPPDEIADIPSSLAAVILKLLEKSPEDRYQSASGLLADLDRVASGEPFTPGDRDRPARFAIPERLYGRQAALDLLLATFDRVRRGGREVVFVEGVAGMGKTSLVLEACRTLQHRGGAVVTGKFDPFERNRPYASLARALGQLVRRMLGERPEDVERWRARIREAVGPNGAIVVGLIPELAHLLGEQPAVPELPALESEARLHRTVRRFVRALGDRQRPLVLFLDDLQWADPPSLALLRVLATDASSGAVLLIGAYRSDAVGPVLRGLLHELRTSDVHVAHLGVGPLTVDDVAHLLRDTLYRDDVEALAVLCRAKTGGNPFFLNRFLVSLAARDLVRFDGDAWIWDTPGIAAIEVTENVVDFLTARLAELPEPTQRTLRTASVVGGRFGEARVAGLFPEASFDVALDQGLVEELPPDATGRRFRFAHDRVREAAYATLETSERERLHAALGASLLADDTRLYEVVEHLNAAGAPADPAALGALNLRAGERALAASAHAPAATWLEVARELLGWDTTPESMRRATELAARAAYLTGDHDHMDALVDEAYGHARDAVDRIRALRVRIDARISQNRNSDAIRVGLDALRLVGIDLPARPTEADVGAALGGLPALLDGVDLAGLPGRPPPDDEAVRAAMELTCALAPPAYFVNAVLLPLLGMELVRATVTHGPTAASSYGFALLGLVLCSVGEIDDGYAFGQLALALADGFEDRRARVRSRHVTLGFVRHWKEPASTVLVDYRALFDEAVDIGDFEYAGYIGMMVTIFGFYTGSDLTRVLTSARHYTQVMEETRQEPSLAVQRIVHQGLLNLRGEAADPLELTGELCNEARMLGIFEEIRDPTSLFVLHVIKGVVAALYGAWDVAGRAMDAARGQIHGATSTIHLVALDQWEALRALRDAREGKGSAEAVREPLERLRRWAHHNPEGHGHRLVLIEAEVARNEGRIHEALQGFERAARMALAGGWMAEEALALRLAGETCLDDGLVTASRAYLLEARYAFERWGAPGVAGALEAAHPTRLGNLVRAADHVRTAVTATTGSRDLDVEAVVRVSHAVALEHELGQLVETIVRLSMEASGAQRCAVVSPTDDGLVVTATGTADPDLRVTQGSEPLDGTQAAESIVRYAARTREMVVLGDAGRSELFATDPYVAAYGPISVLAVPIEQQGRLLAVIYLEHRLIGDLFTDQRLALLRVLFGQAAIAVENARLIDTLEEKVRARTGELAAATEQALSANQAKTVFLRSMGHELRTPLNAILGFAQLLPARRDDPVAHAEAVQTIQDSGRHLLSLVDDLLDMSRIEAGRLELDLETVRLAGFTESVTGLFAPALREKGLSMRVETGGIPASMRTDPRRLRQILLNVIGNAVKFTTQGGIQVSVRGAAGWLRFTVVDTGPGIAPAQIERIFEPFEQAGEAAQRSMGTGLGLAIARQLARQMGGDLAVSSVLGRGSTFVLTLPIVGASEEPLVAASVAMAPARDDAPARPPEAELAVLRALAEEGAMFDLARAAEALGAREPLYEPFTRRVAALAAAFDDVGVERILAT